MLLMLHHVSDPVDVVVNAVLCYECCVMLRMLGHVSGPVDVVIMPCNVINATSCYECCVML